ncbi:MAG: UvrB/UvrC motif-containing protein [Phycisphaerae bacterium]
MICQICKKLEATIHLTEITNGNRSEVHLCQACAVEQGIAIKNQMPLNELLGNLLAAAPADEELMSDLDSEQVCPNCGMTLEQFRKEALFGCPNDYDVFEKTMAPLIEKAQDGHCSHCGKIPSKAPADTKKQLEILSLRQKLDAAVRTEDYEKAAEIRDQINELEKNSCTQHTSQNT